MLALFLNVVYLGLAACMLPVVLWKRARTRKYRRGWSQKLWGQLPDLQSTSTATARAPVIWLHAVSVGEVLQLQQIVSRLRTRTPSAHIVITTTTETGYDVARQKLTDCTVTFFPLDFTWSVRNALDRIQPTLICLVELELWPNFILEAHRRSIPLLLINGRLSANSFKGYSKIQPLVQRLLNCFQMIAVQAEEYRERFLALGAAAERVVTTGSIKFDGVQTRRDNPRTQILRDWLQLKPGTPVLIAGSTQDPEEEILLRVYEQLLHEHPQLRLIIVPRHPERGDAIAQAITQRGFPILRRSQPQVLPPSSKQPVVGLLDTVGELGACWGLADLAFVGGSFGNRGGQNMLEPAAYGAAVCFGPNTWNFRPIVEMLHAADAVQAVQNEAELLTFFREMLTHPQQAADLGERARRLVLSQQGATDRTVELIIGSLPAEEHIAAA